MPGFPFFPYISTIIPHSPIGFMHKIYRLFCWAAICLFTSGAYAQKDSTMYAHFINVGQAASVLLEFPCGVVLIDAGAQDTAYHRRLTDYLTRFFEKRKDLHRTIALLMVTHPHIDHNEALKDIAREFHVARYIDDGLRVGSGRFNQKWMQDTVRSAGIPYESFSFEDITKGGNKEGLTDSIIDPIDCANGDPQIILYSGRFDQRPDNWTQSDFRNYNNHSLVIKVIFGKASFLFTGDLETKGIKAIVDKYAGTGALDVDVLMVGHHGAANATTEAYLSAVTPVYAVISCGEWNYGQGSNNHFTTYAYGHPRISTLNMLEERIPGRRSQVVHIEAAEASKKFRYMYIDKRIYATPWDQTIIIRATADGKYRVTTDN